MEGVHLLPENGFIEFHSFRPMDSNTFSVHSLFLNREDSYTEHIYN
jgi:hypothetical protein